MGEFLVTYAVLYLPDVCEELCDIALVICRGVSWFADCSNVLAAL